MKTKHNISKSNYQMLFDYLAKFLKISDKNFYPHLEKILTGWWCSGRDEELHKEGQVCKKAWFITKGMAYLYFTDKLRGEIIFMLFRAGEITLISDSFMNKKPSTSYLKVCSGTELLEITKKELELMHITFRECLLLENSILAVITEKTKDRETLLCLEPEARMITFFALYPELHPYTKTVRMIDKNIANYLHIDQSHYSKFKKKHYPKKSR